MNNWYFREKFATGFFEPPPKVVESISAVIMPLWKKCTQEYSTAVAKEYQQPTLDPNAPASQHHMDLPEDDEGFADQVEQPNPNIPHLELEQRHQFTVPVDLTGWKYTDRVPQIAWNPITVVAVCSPPDTWDGRWVPQLNTMFFKVIGRNFTPAAEAMMQQAIVHESIHFTQSYVSTAIGRKMQPPSAGMPPKKVRTREFDQNKPDKQDYTHDLDDSEFQSELNDAYFKMQRWIQFTKNKEDGLRKFLDKSVFFTHLLEAGKVAWGKLRYAIHTLRSKYEAQYGYSGVWAEFEKKCLQKMFP